MRKCVCVERERKRQREREVRKMYLNWNAHQHTELRILIHTGIKRQERDKSVPTVRKEK